MAKITNPSKLLASSNSSAIAKIGKSNILAKTSPLSKGLLATKQSKDVSDANKKLVNIDKFLKSDLIVSQKKAEVKRKSKEKQDFDEAEKKLETPKLKGFKFPSLGLPSLGFFDRVKRFLFFTALGWLLPKIIEFLPKLEGFAKIVGGIYNFAEGLFGKLFDGFMSLVKFGGDLKDKTIGFIASAKAGVGGNYQKEFDKLEKQFNTFVNASIIAGVLAADIGYAAVDEFNKQRKGQKPAAGKPTAKAGAKVTQGKVPGWWNNLFKGPFAKLKGPLSRFGGSVIPGLGAVVGAADATARFKAGDNIGGALASVSAALDAATAASALTGIGLPVAGVLGLISMSIDVVLLIRDILSIIPGIPKNLLGFSRGGRVVKRYQGGGTTRGGRPVGGPKRRSITPTRRKPPRITLPKTQPGKDVGGEKKVKEFYAKPEDPSKKYTRPAGGWLANLGKEKQDLSAFDTLNKMSGTLKSDETLAKGILGVMSSGIDMALGQKPDKKVFKAFFDSIGYIADTLANQRTSKSMSSLRSQIGAFAEGGTVPSRGLRGTYGDTNTGDMLAKLIGPTIDQRVNEAIQSIEKQLQMKGAGGSAPGTQSGTQPGDGGGGGPSVESINMSGLTPDDIDALGRMIQAEAGNQSAAGKASVMNVILNRYRLAKAGKGYLPRGRTKDNVTIKDILYAPNEFSPIDDGRFDKTSSASGKSALAQAISAGGNDPEKLKKVLMEKYKLNEQDANYVVVSTAFSNPESRSSRPFGTKEVTVGNHTFQESPYARLNAPGQRIDSRVVEMQGVPTSKLDFKKLGMQVGERAGYSESRGRVHAGRDIAIQQGTPLRTVSDAEIVDVNYEDGGYGHYIIYRDKNGREHMYGHMQDRSKFKKGDKVLANTIIGYVGSTGRSTGPHLHWEVSNKPGEVGYSRKNVVDPIDLGYSATSPFGGEVNPKKQSPKPGQQPISSSQQSKENIIKALSQKGDIPLTVNGESYFFKVDPSQKNPYKVFKRNFLGLGYSEIDITGDKNKAVQDAMRDKIRTMYAPTPSRGPETGYGEHSGGKGQGGGLISPSKPNRAIPNSFASYENYGSGMMIAIQPIIIEKSVPVSGGGNRMIAFPVPVAVNSNMDLSLSRG